MQNKNLDEQIKIAEKEKLIAEIEKTIVEKRKIEIEAGELEKEYSRNWIKRKEFWSILIGTLIAWTAVGFYITFSVVPLSEIHVNQATLENLKKSDILYKKENLLFIATQEIKIRQLKLASLQIENERQKSVNVKLKLQIDNYYKEISKFTLTNNGENRLKQETFKLKQYLEKYNNTEKKSLEKIQPIIESNKPISDNSDVSDNFEKQLSQFKNQQSNDALNIELAKNKELLDKVNAQIRISVAKLAEQLGSNFTTIQSGKGYNFKKMTYEDRFGIISSFDNTKKIWPSYIIKISDSQLLITMKDENRPDQTFSKPIINLNVSDIDQFIRNYFISRLDELK